MILDVTACGVAVSDKAQRGADIIRRAVVGQPDRGAAGTAKRCEKAGSHIVLPLDPVAAADSEISELCRLHERSGFIADGVDRGKQTASRTAERGAAFRFFGQIGGVAAVERVGSPRGSLLLIGDCFRCCCDGCGNTGRCGSGQTDHNGRQACEQPVEYALFQ